MNVKALAKKLKAHVRQLACALGHHRNPNARRIPGNFYPCIHCGRDAYTNRTMKEWIAYKEGRSQ